MLNYYVINERTPENLDFYFSNEGVFNFWNEYLLIRINKVNIVVVNKPNFKFSGIITEGESKMVKARMKNEFCGAKGCAENTTSLGCEIIRDWGKEVCGSI